MFKFADGHDLTVTALLIFGAVFSAFLIYALYSINNPPKQEAPAKVEQRVETNDDYISGYLKGYAHGYIDGTTSGECKK